MRHFLHSCLGLYLFTLIGCSSSMGSRLQEVDSSVMQQQAADPCFDASPCTREYRPMICQYDAKTFESANLCETQKLIKHYACANKLNFDAEQMSCEEKQPPKAKRSAEECRPKSFCIEVYEPHICVFNGQKFEGTNRCFSLQKVQSYACQYGLTFEVKTIACEKLIEPMEPAN